MPAINIVTQLLCFLALAIALSWLTFNWLLIVAILLILIIIFNKISAFYKSILRLKWFFIIMFIIFAFNMPGEHLDWHNLPISPTIEGLQAGAAQMLRIIIMLAAISLILAKNTKQQLISGFYFLCQPLQKLGIRIDRFVARLWLTLHYVEAQQANQHNTNFLQHLSGMRDISTENNAQTETSISFEMPIFTPLDYVVVTLLLLSMAYFFAKDFW